MTLRKLAADWALRLALVGLLLQVGGSLYEHLVLDPAWPTNPLLIQPDHGGVDRKAFWIPAHALAQLALPVALWAVWRDRAARGWVLFSLGSYTALRAWTFAYFIPAALRFETESTVDASEARTWVMWSLLRAPLLLAATYAARRASNVRSFASEAGAASIGERVTAR